FLPWGPLGDAEGGPAVGMAEKYGVTPQQVVLAWLLARSPAILPIPGTSSVAHLEQNVAAAALELTPAEIETLNHQGDDGPG
ncbi:MAG: aldo/keto reductase, partial [Actinomycetota bacterium]|nr:aldo/keto reductase [Actinomycetota bacterium]